MAVVEAKQQVWEEFGEAMKKDLRVAQRRFWKTVQHLRREKWGTIQAVWDLANFN